MSTVVDLESRLLDRLRRVQDTLGIEPPADAGTRFADAVDSMGLVEFLALVAEDCGVSVEAVEQATGRRFGTVAELAAALAAAGLAARRPGEAAESLSAPTATTRLSSPAWLAATAVRLPAARQTAADIDSLLGRPAGWLEAHAGIRGRAVWADQDAVDVAARAAADCLEQAAVPAPVVAALLVVSEAPPQPVGLAAVLHHRIGLPADCVALEVGGACAGFLSALWIARRLLNAGPALVVAVEAPSRRLETRPGPAGEAAALFGDGAAACLLAGHPSGANPLILRDIVLEADGSANGLLGVRRAAGGFEMDMDGMPLAQRALRGMARSVRAVVHRLGLEVVDLDAVVMHGGNDRMPPLLARQLGLPAERVASATGDEGNLGAASLPAAWAARPVGAIVAWTAAGAGMQWGAALWGASGEREASAL
jgi:3-oxoacyl-[acyl-carrier-protein] synthase-3